MHKRYPYGSLRYNLAWHLTNWAYAIYDGVCKLGFRLILHVGDHTRFGVVDDTARWLLRRKVFVGFTA